MANQNIDIIRVEDTEANLPNTLIAGQLGFTTDTNKLGHLMKDGITMQWYTSTVDSWLIWDSNGNGGITTDTMDGKLHIWSGSAGVATASSTANELVLENSTHCGISMLAPDDMLTSIYFGSPSHASGAYIYWNYDDDNFVLGTNKLGSYTEFYTSNNVIALTLDASQNAQFEGNVHVYTGDAGAITADVWADNLVLEEDGVTGMSILSPDADGSIIQFGSPSNSNGAAISWSYTSADLAIGTNVAGAVMKLNTGNGAQAVYIDSSQQVGIGTSTSPAQMLDVQGNAIVRGHIYHSADNEKNYFGEADDSSITYNGTNMIFNSQEVGSGDFVFSGGNLGIEVTPESWDSSYTALQIGGLGSLFSQTVPSAGVETYLCNNVYLDAVGWKRIVNDEASFYKQVNGTHTWYSDAASAPDIAFTPTARMSINSSGYTTMSITSTAAIQPVLAISNPLDPPQAGYGAALDIGHDNGSYAVRIACVWEQSSPSFLNGAMVFYTMNGTSAAGSGVERMRITSIGDVGIGTTAPSEKLGVVGNAKVSGTVEIGDHIRSTTSIYRRYYHLPLASFDPGLSGATWTSASANNLCGWQLNAAGETLEFSTDVHSDWDEASDLEIEVSFQLLASGSPSDTVDLQLISYYMGNGDVATKTQTVEVATVTDGTQYKMYTASFTIDYDAVSNVVDAGDRMCFVLNLETDTSEIDDILIIDASFNYDTTHIGIEDGDT